MSALSCILAGLLGYLFGSIPFGLILTKLAGLGDIREIGSGNIGATNVLRTGRKELAILTLLLDGGKGALAVLIAQCIWPLAGIVTGACALIGHLFPVWLKFKGGKGVATAIGVITVLSWPMGLMTAFLWLLIAALTRYSSLAALVSIGFLPIAAYIFKRPDMMWFSVFILFFIFIKHGSNIQRLVKGRETRIGQKKYQAPPPRPR